MYKADDLQEETEKIVLRRAKAGVDRAKLGLEFAQAAHEEPVKLSLPRIEEKTKDQTERSRIDTELTKINLPLLMGKHRLELDKLQVARTFGEERLKEAQRRSRGDDRQGPHRRDRLLRPVGAGKVVGHRAWKRSAAGRRSCPTTFS